MRLGLISEADIQFALSRQFAYAYLRKTPGETRPLSDELVAAYQPFSARVEQLRAIRSQLMLRWFDQAEERQVLTVVGAERGEGRSYLAGQPGDRVLPARRAHAARRRRHARAAPALPLLLENRIGFSTAARRPRRARKAIVRIPDLRRAVGAAGRTDAAESARAAEPPQLRRVLIQIRASYDVIIVDTPAHVDRRRRGDDRRAHRRRAGRRALRHDPRRRVRRPACRACTDAGVVGGRLGAERSAARKKRKSMNGACPAGLRRPVGVPSA